MARYGTRLNGGEQTGGRYLRLLQGPNAADDPTDLNIGDLWGALRGQSTTMQVHEQQAMGGVEDNRETARRLMARLAEQGITSGNDWERLEAIAVEGQEEKRSLFGRVLDWLDVPGKLVRTAVADVFDIGEGEHITRTAYSDILTQNTRGLLERYGPEVVGEDARMSFSQLLTLMGNEEATTGWGKFGRGLLSFAGEVALDPLSYVGLGALGASKDVIYRTARHVLERATFEGAELAGRTVGRSAMLAARQAERVERLLPKVLQELGESEARALGREGGEVVAREILADAIEETGKSALEIAQMRAVDEAMDEMAPRLIARQWAAPEVADLVNYHATPAFLRGGIHIAPLPIFRSKLQHAATIPGTRGTGKWISQHLFGKASSVIGQKATGLRAIIENVSPLYHSWEAFTTRFDAGAWLRAVQKGDIPAGKTSRMMGLINRIKSKESAAVMSAEVSRLHVGLVEAASKAGLKEGQIDELTSNTVIRLFENTRRMGPDQIRSEAAAALRNLNLPVSDLAEPLSMYAEGWHRLFRDRFERGTRFEVLPENPSWAGVPAVPTKEGDDLLGDLVEHGAWDDTGDLAANILNLHMGHLKVRSASGGVIGEAGHALERTLGMYVLPLSSRGGTVMVDLTGLIKKMPEASQADLFWQLGMDARAAAGQPVFRSIVDLNRMLTERAVEVAKKTRGVRVPRGEISLLETHPIKVAASYLADVNAAIVERAVMEHMADLGLVEKATRVRDYHQMAFRGARTLNPDSGGDWAEEVGKAAAAAEKETGKIRKAAERTVTVRSGGQSFTISELAATPKLMEGLQKPLAVLDAGEVGRREILDREDALVRRMVKSGMGEEQARALAVAADVGNVRPVLAEAEKMAVDNARAAAQTMMMAAIRGQVPLADAARLMSELSADVDGVGALQRRASAALAGRFRRRNVTVHTDIPVEGELLAGATDAAFAAAEGVQRQVRGLDDEVSQALLHVTSLAADRNATAQTLTEAAGTLDELLAAQRNRLGAVGAEEALVRAGIRRLAEKGGKAEALAEKIAETLSEKDGLRRAVALLEAEAPPDVLERAVQETLLIRGLPDLASATLDVAADLGGLRDSIELLRWLRTPSRVGLSTRRINRALLDGAGMAPDTRVVWGRNVAGEMVPSFRSSVREGVGASYGQVGRELRRVGLPASEARRLLAAGEETAEIAALSTGVRQALLHAEDEGAGLMDDWLRLGEKRTALSRLRSHGRAGLPVPDHPLVSTLTEAGENQFAARIGQVRKLPAGWRRGDKAATDRARQLGVTIGDNLRQPTAQQLRGARLFLSDGATAGFGVSAEGEIFGLFNTQGRGVGRALLARAQAKGGTWASVPQGSRARALFEEMGFRPQLGDEMHLIPEQMQEMANLHKTHAQQIQVLEGISDALTEGRLDDVERVLNDSKVRRLLAEYPEQRDLLLDHVKAVRALRDPNLPDGLKELVRDRQRMLAGTISRERALTTLAEVDAALREQMREQIAAPWREALEGADGFVRALATLQDNLWAGPQLRYGKDAETANKMIADVIAQARRGGWEKEAKRLEDAFEASRTYLPPKGQVMFRAYSLSGHVVEFAAGKPSIALIMENLVSQLQTMSSPAGLRYLAHQARSITEWWKAMATVARPTFHIRNLVGATFNNMIGDVRVRDYLWVRDKFIRLRHAQSQGLSVPEAIAKVAKTQKDREVLTAIWENGVLESSFASTLHERLIREADLPLRRKMYPLGRSGPLVKAGSFTMGTIEDFMRASCFKRWYDDLGAEAATSWTFALHFDYKNLAHLERAIKTVVPFFVWTRRNLPLQMRVLAERPDLVQRYAHLMHGFNEDADPNSPYDMPMGPSNGLKIGTSMVFNADTPFWARLIVSPDVPLTDLGNIDNPISLQSWMRFLTGTLGPAVQIPMMLAKGEEGGYGGQVNAPAGLNEILLGLHAMGFYDEVYDGAARMQRTWRSLGEAIIPAWSEYARPWETDPGRRQALGLVGQREAMSGEVARAIGLHMVGRGVGMRTQTPTMAYSNALSVNDFLASLEYELEHQGTIPSNSDLIDDARAAQLAGLLPEWP